MADPSNEFGTIQETPWLEFSEKNRPRWHGYPPQQRWFREKPSPIGEEEEIMTPTIVRQLAEQCDRCGARAKVRAEFFAGELFFCLHHARELGVTERAITIDYLAES